MSFDDVIGHEGAKTQLKLRFSKGDFPHAMLFWGPKGVGKRVVAVECACQLLGAHAQKRIREGLYPDCIDIQPNERGLISINQIRELKARVVLKPLEGSRTVVLLDEAHAMNEEAQNALLKVLEEPPRNVFLILLSSQPGGLKPTVLSRCQRLMFKSLTREEVSQIRERAEGSTHSLDTERMQGLLHLLKEGGASKIPDWSRMKRDEIMCEVVVLSDMLRDCMIIKAQCGGRIKYEDHRYVLEEIAERFSMEQIDELLLDAFKLHRQIDQYANIKIAGFSFWNRAFNLQ
jgi:Cdc6-like AAA superfamily ATPase